MMNNALAIHLNNNAVDELKKGCLLGAIESISQACHVLANTTQNHTHSSVDPSRYRFTWCDCSQDGFDLPTTTTTLISSTTSTTTSTFHKTTSRFTCNPFLYLSLLKIAAPNDEYETRLCPCGFAWAIWYNLSIVYAVAGGITGERGRELLLYARNHLKQVKYQVQPEADMVVDDPSCSSRDWSRLQVAVLNNLAWISNELCLSNQLLRDQLKEMQLSLVASSKVLDRRDWKEFSFNLYCMREICNYANAA